MSKTKFILCLMVSGQLACADELTDEVMDAYFRRDYSVVERYLSAENNVTAEWLRIALLARRADTDDATSALERFLAANSHSAALHFDSAELWRVIGKRAGIFSRGKYYAKVVAAYIKAAELEPDNALYLKHAATAKSYNGSWFSADVKAQRMVIDQLKGKDDRYLLMAEMDYVQNTDDKKQGRQLISQALQKYDHDLDVLERTGQLLWTYRDDEQAQRVFTQACNLPAAHARLWLSWQSACFISGKIALDGVGDRAAGLSSLKRLLSEERVHDDEYAETQALHDQLEKKLLN